MERLLRRNIWIYHLHAALSSFMLFIPFLVLFATEKIGMSYSGYMTTEIAFSIGIILFEVPTGVIADKYSRKLSWIMGSGFLLTGAIGFALMNSFWGLLSTQIIWATMVTFHSGSNQAMIYDSLVQLNEEERFPKIISKNSAIASASAAIGGITGGLLLRFMPIRGLFYLYLIPAVAVFLLSFLLKEPESVSEKSEIKFFEHIKESVKFISKNEYLLPLIIFMSLVPAFTKSIFWLFTPTYLRLGVPEEWWGALNSTNIIVGVITTYFAGNLLQKFGVKKLVGVVAAGLTFGLMTLFSKSIILVVIGLAIANNTRHLARIAGSTELNKSVDSKKRATVLSLAGLLTSLIFSIGSLVTTFVLDKTNYEWAIIAIILIYLIPTILISSKLIIKEK